jgi:DHA1 family multidrug resistance protein B-like MFS transporter
VNFFRLHRNIQVRIISLFLSRTASNTVFPFIGIYFADELGNKAAGLILFSVLFVTMLITFPGGYLADRFGRKRIMLIAEGMMFAAFVGMTLANIPQIDSVWLTWVMMLLHSVGMGISLPASDALLIDASNQENRRTVYTLHYWVHNLSILFGSMIGGLFFLEHRIWLFAFLAAASAINLVLFAVFITELMPASQKNPPSSRFWGDFAQNYRIVAGDRLFILYWLASLAIFFLEFQFPYYITVQLHQEFPVQTFTVPGLFTVEVDGIRAISWIRIENTVLIVAGTILLSSMLKKIPDPVALQTGIVLYTLGYSSLVLIGDFGLLLLAVLTFSLGEIIFIPVKQAMLAEIADENARSSYMATHNLIFHFGRWIGSLGITIGAWIPPEGMALLFLLSGIVGFTLFRMVLRRMSSRLSTPSSKKGQAIEQS